MTAARIWLVAAAAAAAGACQGPPAAPPVGPPASFGGGFVDLTTAIEDPPPFVLTPGDPLGIEPEPTMGGFADLDGDGVTDVLVSYQGFAMGGRSCVAYAYDAAAGRLVPHPGVTLPADVPLNAAVDLDGDGVTDLITSTRGREVYWGLGDGAFAPRAGLESPPTTEPESSFDQFTLADIDGDGWLDVLLGDGRCCADCRTLHPLLRTGARSFADRVDLVTSGPPLNPYAMVAAALGPDAMVLGGVGFECPGVEIGPVFYRQHALDADGYPLFEPVETAPASVEPVAHHSPMGAAVGDLDDDGADELALTFNPERVILRGGAAWPLADATSDDFRVARSDLGAPMLPWGVAFLDLDRDLRKDVVVVHGNDFGGWFDAGRFTGPQHSSIYWNGGQFRFADVGDALGVTRRGQWRALTVGDLDDDGDADLIIGGQGELPRVLRNDVDTGNHGLALRLRGTTSNHLGIGARIAASVGAGTGTQHYLMGGVFSPYGLSAPLVFVAAGTATTIARLTISWPSGVEQVLTDVPTGGVLVVDEPPLFVITPATRHLPADGASRATIRVTPQRGEGARRAGSAVAVDARLLGPGSIATARDGDDWLIHVVAPASPGSTAVEIRIDGVAAGVRPRLFWD